MDKAQRKRKVRGVFERPPGSGIWWVNYFDASGRRRREKVGSKSAAIALYQKRKVEARQGKKLPENLRAKAVTFNKLADEALSYSKARKRSWDDDVTRMAHLREWFGSCPAEEITPGDIERRLTQAAEEHGWAPATVNRHKALLSLTFRLAVESGKVSNNPARLVRGRRENNGRLRFLSLEEEARLRKVIRERFPEHELELDLSLNTGMRLSEQYGLRWECVNFERRVLTIPRSKHGETRHIPLNSQAVAALELLRARANGHGRVILNERGEPRVSPRNWFEPAVKAAKISDFSWHCLRHTFASRLVMAGVDLRTVQELMGHKTIQMTVRYAHLAPDHQLAAVERLTAAAVAVSEPTATRTATGHLGRSANGSRDSG